MAAVKRKAAKKKAAKKAPAGTKKKAGAKKLGAKKSVQKARKGPVRRAGVKKAAKKSPPARPEREIVKAAPLVEPGPPAGSVPPVEEPTTREDAVGVVTHYYSHLAVAVVQVNKGELRTGDRVRIKGHTTDLVQIVGSMEYEHEHIDAAGPGSIVGLKVTDHVRVHDIIYRIR